MVAFDSGGDGLRPIEAVLVARSFLRKYVAELTAAPAEANKEVPQSHREQFGPAGIRVFRPDQPPRALSCLLDCAIDYIRHVENKPKFDVGVRLVEAKSIVHDGDKIDPFRVIRSLITIEGENARIHIVKQLNECWRRFACVKELSHLIMGMERGEVIFNPRQQLQLAFRIGDPAIDWNKDVSRELFAWLMAIELGLPYWHRQCLHRQIEQGVDRMLIAQHFRVPKPVIDLYAETQYGKKSMEILASIDD
jgi:hypothetical protein